MNLICVYAPTLLASDDTKDHFYSQLDALIKTLPEKEELIVLGDFNARVGKDNDAWPNCLGNFGIGKCNDNGQRLLELCTYHDLCVATLSLESKNTTECPGDTQGQNIGTS